MKRIMACKHEMLPNNLICCFVEIKLKGIRNFQRIFLESNAIATKKFFYRSSFKHQTSY